jgi:tetraacyldisaccharide 4'-kinase
MKVFFRELWYGTGSPPWPLRVVLLVLSRIFAGLVAARGFLYGSGLLAAQRVACRVISIGNISVGGSGKTPLVLWMVRKVRAADLSVAVVSRGYGGSSGAVRVVGGEGGRLEDADGAADEAVLLALRAACPVVTGKDRVAAARLAVARFSPDLVIMDDGFQHRRLARDLDLVIAPDPDHERELLPAGPLREPLAALGRADLVVEVRRSALGLVSSVESELPDLELSRLGGARVLAVAGIAGPGAFVGMLREAGAEIVETLLFSDHYRYGPEDLEKIRSASLQADLVVTTEKDLVKLADLDVTPAQLLALRIAIKVSEEEEIISRILEFDPNRV